jgi:hypothetical protein
MRSETTPHSESTASGATDRVVTRMNVLASAAQVWTSLMYYESIEESPPWLLRVLLPRPIRTVGSKSAVGDQATCLYEGGHLLKQVTRLERRRLYEFCVVEQNLRIGGRVALSGGSYGLAERPDGTTDLTVMTGYVSRNRPRWLALPVERLACHLFHRHLLRSIKRKAEAGAAVPVV